MKQKIAQTIQLCLYKNVDIGGHGAVHNLGVFPDGSTGDPRSLGPHLVNRRPSAAKLQFLMQISAGSHQGVSIAPHVTPTKVLVLQMNNTTKHGQWTISHQSVPNLSVFHLENKLHMIEFDIFEGDLVDDYVLIRPQLERFGDGIL